jgi:hypothetical protein
MGESSSLRQGSPPPSPNPPQRNYPQLSNPHRNARPHPRCAMVLARRGTVRETPQRNAAAFKLCNAILPAPPLGRGGSTVRRVRKQSHGSPTKRNHHLHLATSPSTPTASMADHRPCGQPCHPTPKRARNTSHYQEALTRKLGLLRLHQTCGQIPAVAFARASQRGGAGVPG